MVGGKGQSVGRSRKGERSTHITPNPLTNPPFLISVGCVVSRVTRPVLVAVFISAASSSCSPIDILTDPFAADLRPGFLAWNAWYLGFGGFGFGGGKGGWLRRPGNGNGNGNAIYIRSLLPTTPYHTHTHQQPPIIIPSFSLPPSHTCAPRKCANISDCAIRYPSRRCALSSPPPPPAPSPDADPIPDAAIASSAARWVCLLVFLKGGWWWW